jgi:hypothetical protein
LCPLRKGILTLNPNSPQRAAYSASRVGGRDVRLVLQITLNELLEVGALSPLGGISTLTGSMTAARSGHTGTSFGSSGTVLITGGSNSAGDLSSAEVYDPAAATFTATGSMSLARSLHTATLLPSGMVLIIGGGPMASTAEVYDTSAGTFAAAGNMTSGKQALTATLLPGGMVFIAGGFNAGSAGSTAKLYNPTTATFTTTGNMTSPVVATLLVRRELH